MKRIVVLGGGFAGLWSAIGAARKLDEHGIGQDAVRVTLVDQNDFHSIRVRNYEEELDATVVPFAQVLDPIGVEHLRGVVAGIDTERRAVSVRTAAGVQELRYDRLVHALGSRLQRPSIPGLAEHSFDIDTYHGAKRLDAHLHALARDGREPDRLRVLVVGAGLTGIELATELPGRLAKMAAQASDRPTPRVILADASPLIGPDMGDEARAVIVEALAALGVDTRTGVAIESVDPRGVTLAGGERMAAATVVWCAGMRANELGEAFPAARDRLGRLEVDEFMRVRGLPHVFAAGDAARAVLDGEHASVMSCQHGRPMGRYAGHNAAADLIGQSMLPLRIDWYVTVLDLGGWGAVYTGGWDRRVISTREAAKATKRTINRLRIYPPLSGDRAEILAAAAPQVQEPPEVRRLAGAADGR
ncbi:proton-conducting membrane transporter [Pigmentiphaga sp. NML080357]|uniref:NAD(P)/FAD-dependent oxidoreductase n=1 Tax=Pigmentiphaga sp. NML080357 TaxID=2008675 RepID=UPI000B41F14F|nr:NAD(P)/FAD-dependent oxidoreductase [Pigmentiphaga sp. NML080357]OVZ60316.1 proton-conducting membrane transporter [Pigmentiphaga sp. NML080357]